MIAFLFLCVVNLILSFYHMYNGDTEFMMFNFVAGMLAATAAFPPAEAEVDIK